MQTTRQHIPFFMGVYEPPSGDIASGVNIRICNMPTVITMEVFAITITYMQALATSLRRISGRNNGQFNATSFTLICKKRSQLVERPRVDFSFCVFCFSLLIRAFSDIRKVFDSDTLMLRFSLFDKLLANSVICNGNKPMFTSFQPFQQLVTVACAFGLNRGSCSIVFVSDSIDFRRGECLPIGSTSNVCDSHINTNKLLYGFFFLFRDVNSLKKKEFFSYKNKVCFSLGILHKLWTMADIRNLFSTRQKTYRNHVAPCIGEYSTVISNRSKLSKLAHLFPIKLISISDLANRSYYKLGREMICSLYSMINFLVDTKLTKYTAFPCYLRDNITRLVEGFHSLLQGAYLSLIRHKSYLQRKFHTANINNLILIFKYLREIVVESFKQKKESAQFLPQLKQWVPLGVLS